MRQSTPWVSRFGTTRPTPSGARFSSSFSVSQASMGALLYRSALHAGLTRDRMFRDDAVPTAPASRDVSGTLNGTPFTSLSDGDPRIGPRLEVFAAGQYTLLP